VDPEEMDGILSERAIVGWLESLAESPRGIERLTARQRNEPIILESLRSIQNRLLIDMAPSAHFVVETEAKADRTEFRRLRHALPAERVASRFLFEFKEQVRLADLTLEGSLAQERRRRFLANRELWMQGIHPAFARDESLRDGDEIFLDFLTSFMQRQLPERLGSYWNLFFVPGNEVAAVARRKSLGLVIGAFVGGESRRDAEAQQATDVDHIEDILIKAGIKVTERWVVELIEAGRKRLRIFY
jgi:hypothetical protein